MRLWVREVGKVPGLCPWGIWKTRFWWKLQLIWFLKSWKQETREGHRGVALAG